MEFLKGRKISQREKVLLILVGVAAIAAAFYFFIYQSQIEQMASIRSQLAENNKKLNELRGFDAELKSLEKEVDDLDTKIADATMKWFPSLRQDVIIKDLESKIKRANLTDGTVKFKSSKEASIAEFDDETKLPTIAEALTLSFVTLMQEQPQQEGAQQQQQQQSLVDAAGNLIEKVSDTLAVATPTPGPNGSGDTTTAFAAQANPTGQSKPKDGELSPEVQAKLDALKKSLSGLTETELKKQIEKILANTDAKVDKLEVQVDFKNSSYHSIMDFIDKIERSSPNIYVSSMNYTNSTDTYVNQLQSEEIQLENKRVELLNLFRAQEDKSPITPNEIEVQYNGVDKYNGSITLVYFAVSKIHKDSV